MKLNTLSRRTAAAGAASALVAGGLVGATTSTAEAAPITNTYTCTTPVGPADVTLDSDAIGIEGFDGVLSAGAAAPAGAMTVTNQFTISDAFHQTLVDFGIEDVSFPDFAGTFGESAVPVEGMAVTVSGMTQNADTTWSTDNTTEDGDPVEGSGLNGAFEAPSGGDHEVLAPAEFTMRADLDGTPVDVACSVQGAPQSYATLTVNKNNSESKAKAKNSPVTKGKAAKVAVTVSAPNETPTGKVILKKKSGKTLDKATLNDQGKATLKSKALKVGKNKLKVVYKGDGYTNGSKDNVTVKVVKP